MQVSAIMSPKNFAGANNTSVLCFNIETVVVLIGTCNLLLLSIPVIKIFFRLACFLLPILTFF